MTNFIVTADTGSGSIDQYKVAKSMEILNNTNKINSVLLLGDNIYEHGVTSSLDPQFKTKFEDPYHNINKPFYLCLGNHDYGNSFFLKNNAGFQVSYSDISEKWNMPDKYYSIKGKDYEIFMLDTNLDLFNEKTIMKQFHIMSDKIKNSNKKWKIVCGHHPWRSVGGHGNAERRLEIFMNDLFKVGAEFDLYMCGHDHCKNIIMKNHPFKKNKLITLLVIGTGGKKYHAGEDGRPELHNMQKGDSDLLFHSPNLGSCIMKITNKNIKLICYNEKLIEEYTHIIQK